MAQSASQRMDAVDSDLATVFGTRSRLGIVEALARRGRLQQVEIAEDIGVTEATISREKQPLIDAGVIQEIDPDGDGDVGRIQLRLRPDYSEAISQLLRAIRMPDSDELQTEITQIEGLGQDTADNE